MIRVALVDDQALMRAGFRALLEAEDGLEVVGEAADGEQGLALVRAQLPDIALVDVQMPVMTGIEATRRIAADPALAAVRVVILTNYGLDEYVFEALRAGASGFLLKDTEPADLLQAIEVVAHGEALLSPSVTRTLIERIRDDTNDDRAGTARQRLAVLTGREHDVALAVGRGLTNAEIARELHLSVPTVKAHVSRLFDKLQVTNRVQIAICVHDAGLV